MKSATGVVDVEVSSYPADQVESEFGIGRTQRGNWFKALGVKTFFPNGAKNGKAYISASDMLKCRAYRRAIDDGYKGDLAVARALKAVGAVFSTPETGITYTGPSMPTLPEKADPLTTAIDALAQSMEKQSQRSILDKYETLQQAKQNIWYLTADEIADLIGVRPRGEEFNFGSYRFKRGPRAGRQNTYRVLEVDFDD